MIQRTAVVGMNMIVRAETAVCCVLNIYIIYVGYTLHHYLVKREIAHYFRTVNVSSDSRYRSRLSVLPHNIVLPVVKGGGVTTVSGYHEMVVGKFALQVTVVKVVVCVEQGLLAVISSHFLYK